MNKSSPSLTRITRPRPGRVFTRQRLHKRLDHALETHLVWVNAPPGSGKTTLLADYIKRRGLRSIWYRLERGDSDAATFFHYLALAGQKAAPRRRTPLPVLTPEYLMGLPAFTRRFFEDLSSRLGQRFCVVFDNYQELPDDSPIHGILMEALSALPEGGTIVILSRVGPLPPFSTLRAEGLMETLEPWDLCLTEEETGGIISLRSEVDWQKDSKEFRELNSGIRGWVGGLVLLLESLAGRGLGGLEPMSLTDLSHDIVFEYFAGEIFNVLGAETRDFLLKTSVIPDMTPVMAETLTKNRRAGRILSTLCRDNYFTEKTFQRGALYRYHPLFREFLLKRAREKFPASAMKSLLRRGARLLEEAGDDEAASALYAEAHDWDSLAALLMRLGPKLLKAGRFMPLIAMLRGFPPARLNKSPWLLYWLGAASAQARPAEAIPRFTRAFELFDEAGDAAGAFLTWTGVVRAVFYEFSDFKRLDHWIDLIEDLMKKYPSFPTEEIETLVTASIFLALLFRQPGHGRIKYWAGRARLLAESSGDENFRTDVFMHLSYFYQFIGDIQQGKVIIERLTGDKGREEVSPLTRLVASTVTACYHGIFGEHAACVAVVSEGLEYGRKSGIRIMDYMLLGQGAVSALADGDARGAHAYLAKMSPVLKSGSPFDLSFYYFLLAWKGLVDGTPVKAKRYALVSMDLVMAIGSPLADVLTRAALTLALYECGERGGAALELSKMKKIAKKTGLALFRYLYLMIEAHMALGTGGGDNARAALERFFATGREFGFLKHNLFIPRIMTRLCKKALEEGIEAEHVKRLICDCSFVPEPPPVELDEWPWPVWIFTLGRFSILRDGLAVRSHGKGMKKPLEMLKVLIALGGRDITEGRLSDILWPEAEGPSSHRTFTITLHRLRTLLDCPKAIKLSEGRVSLDPGCCRVDTWAFERLVGEGERSRKRGERGHATRLLSQALEIYHGPFLAGDKDTPWSTEVRERLRSKFIRCAARLGSVLEEVGEYEMAVDTYRKAIEVEGLAEEIYRNLMLCHMALGQRSAAVALYGRLERILNVRLNLRPASATEAIYRSILRKNT